MLVLFTMKNGVDPFDRTRKSTNFVVRPVNFSRTYITYHAVCDTGHEPRSVDHAARVEMAHASGAESRIP